MVMVLAGNGSITGVTTLTGLTSVTLPEGCVTNTNISTTTTLNKVNLPSGSLLQIKKAVLTSDFITYTAGWQTGLSCTLDNPVTVGNIIFLMAAGVITSGSDPTNWGNICDLFLDNTNLTSGPSVGNYYRGGTSDLLSASGGPNPFSMIGYGTAASTSPVGAIKLNKDSTVNGATGWPWTALGYSFQDYGHTTTSLIMMEIKA